MLPVRTKKIMPGVMMIILITTLLLFSSSIIIARANGPKAVVKEPVKDAGEISSDKKLIHDFIISNDGDAPLFITDVKAACGCTATDYDRMIAPGKTGRIHAVTDISSFTGVASKDIAVFTNDPANPVILLSSRARVIHDHPIVFFKNALHVKTYRAFALLLFCGYTFIGLPQNNRCQLAALGQFA